MDYQFEFRHEPEHYMWENDVLFDFLFRRRRDGIKRLFIYAALFAIVCAANYSIEQYPVFYVFLTGTVVMLMWALSAILGDRKLRKAFNERLEEMKPGFSDNPKYSFHCNDDYYGAKNHYYEAAYRFTSNTVADVYKGMLIIRPYHDSLYAITLTSKEVNEAKFQEVVTAVKDRIAILQEVKGD